MIHLKCSTFDDFLNHLNELDRKYAMIWLVDKLEKYLSRIYILKLNLGKIYF